MRKFLCLILLGFIGCKEKYMPEINEASRNYLVVEGILNSGTGPTNIRISRTLRLVDTTKFKAETNAVVSVQGKDNSNFALIHKGEGMYSADQLNLNINQQYRLLIKTADGKQYASDYVEVKQTPPIDSVTWKRSEKGVEIFVNSHDALNKTKYYKWEYDETWETHSSVAALYDYRNSRVVSIDPYVEKIVYCWKSAPSNQLLLGSTAALSSDVIRQQPLTLIPAGNERLGVRYSIIIRQYALTERAHEFYKLMKKNTEELGSVFGPLPSEVRGNIQNTADPEEMVIGFISASSAQEKRIFINSTEVPAWNFILACNTYRVANNPDSIAYYFPYYRPYDAETDAGGAVTAYFGITPLCADCRLRGGVNVKPAFW
ncbi:MAG TPA: DUF4249 domain-containing protein [Chitinophagaceae bacterium]